MEVVQLRSTTNTSSKKSKYQRQGNCNACNEACRTCKGPQVSDCFQCKDGYERIDDLCQKKLLLNFLDPDMLGFFIWVIVLCIAAIILFGVIFGLLQARDRQLLCWKGKGSKERSKCDYKGINLTPEELENDLENFDIIRNRTFRHASIPECQEPRIHVNNLESVVKFTLDNQSNNSEIKFDKYNGRNNLVRSTTSRNSQCDRRSDFIPAPDYTQKKYQQCDRKSRHSDKNLRRNYTDSYVSYDINSSLTQTLAKDFGHRENSTRDHSSNQNVFHGSRSATAFRH